MNRVLQSAFSLSLLAACSAAPQPEPETAPTSMPASGETRVEVIKDEPQEGSAPDPAQQAKAKQAAKLEQDRAQMRAEHEQELARFTPELKAAAAKVANKAYPSTKAALAVILKSDHRKPGHAARDEQRHPAETLEFFGVTPKQTVLEYGPGEGWYTEILAPLLAKQGKLVATSSDPNGPPDQRSTYYGERFKLFLETSPELYGKVDTVVVDGKAPSLPADLKVDEVLLIRGMHGMVNQGTLDAWLAAFHGALKDKGILGIVQHRAAADADPHASAKQGYLPEAWVIEQVEKAGFKLAKKSEINANPKDTHDYPEGVWTLPPTLALGDVDREKYEGIGESDRMTLKFVKVAKPD